MREKLLAALMTLAACDQSLAATANCSQANAPATSAICRNPILLNLLNDENSLYLKDRGRSAESYAIEKQAEAQFIGRLLQCESVAACLRDRIDERTEQLNAEPDNATVASTENADTAAPPSDLADNNTSSSQDETANKEASQVTDATPNSTSISNITSINSPAPPEGAATAPAMSDRSSPLPVMIFWRSLLVSHLFCCGEQRLRGIAPARLFGRSFISIELRWAAAIFSSSEKTPMAEKTLVPGSRNRKFSFGPFVMK